MKRVSKIVVVIRSAVLLVIEELITEMLMKIKNLTQLLPRKGIENGDERTNKIILMTNCVKFSWFSRLMILRIRPI